MSLEISAEVRDLMTLRRLPGRLTSKQAGMLLGFNEEEMRVLIKKIPRLRALNSSGQIYFLNAEIEELVHDRAWMEQACEIIQTHWRAKNKKAASAPRP